MCEIIREVMVHTVHTIQDYFIIISFIKELAC